MSLAFSKTIDKEINETLTINNDNVKPEKIDTIVNINKHISEGLLGHR